MTKTLTEQWCEGTLPAGCYYVLSTEDDTPVACDIDVACDFMIRDVIVPVPSYNEYKLLQEQLKEADATITSYIRNNPLEKYGPAEAYCERWCVK